MGDLPVGCLEPCRVLGSHNRVGLVVAALRQSISPKWGLDDHLGWGMARQVVDQIVWILEEQS